MQDDEYYESLSDAGWNCLWHYEKDPHFHNDDPYDFVNPSDVAQHVHSILKYSGVDFRDSMNDKEREEFNKIKN